LNQEQTDKIFEEELFPHLDALKTFAYHLTYNDEDAEDLVQETYFKAHKFINHYVTGTNGKAWLFKILKNAYINEYRKKSKRPKQVDYEEVTTYADGEEKPLSNGSDLRDDLFHDKMGDEVTIALNTLPIDFRTVIMLCDIEEFTYEEISKIIDVPIGTVRSRLFRARNILKDKLMEYANNMGYKDHRNKDKHEVLSIDNYHEEE
jgi:RNA polymerase sigma factor (sigma-70 family)